MAAVGGVSDIARPGGTENFELGVHRWICTRRVKFSPFAISGFIAGNSADISKAKTVQPDRRFEYFLDRHSHLAFLKCIFLRRDVATSLGNV